MKKAKKRKQRWKVKARKHQAKLLLKIRDRLDGIDEEEEGGWVDHGPISKTITAFREEMLKNYGTPNTFLERIMKSEKQRLAEEAKQDIQSAGWQPTKYHG